MLAPGAVHKLQGITNSYIGQGWGRGQGGHLLAPAAATETLQCCANR